MNDNNGNINDIPLDKHNKIKMTFKNILKDILFILIIILIVIFVRKNIGYITMVSGPSMENTIKSGEFFIVSKMIDFNELKRGDIIVFDKNFQGSNISLIKRVVGLGGETIIIEKGFVYIKNKDGTKSKLNEQYLSNENFGKTPSSIGFGEKEIVEFKIPDGEILVFGDNRLKSIDSRDCFGNCKTNSKFITKEDFKGKVKLSLGGYSFENKYFIKSKGFMY